MKVEYTMETAVEAINTALRAVGYERMDDESRECLLDPTRHLEAIGMVRDFEARLRVSSYAAEYAIRAMVARAGSPHFMQEFGDYGPLGFTLPEGWQDTSWHNDACPSFESSFSYRLWCDYEEPLHREGNSTERYALCVVPEDASDEFVMGSENAQELLAFAEETKEYTLAQRLFMGQRVTRAKAEVLAAVAYRQPFYIGGKVVPDTIPDFATLHDYCDANCLGGMCEDGAWQEGEALFPDPETPKDDSAWLTACNIIQQAVHLWIANGTMKLQAQQLREKHNFKKEQAA